MQLEVVSPLHDERIAPLLEAAFQRAGRESRLVGELARSHPGFDPGLSLLASEAGQALGYALFLPRTLRLRGAPVRCAIVAALGVHPAQQRRGIGRFLLRAGLAALPDRGLRAAIVIGASELFAPLGFESAFNAYTLRIPAQALPAEDDTASWRGLRASDLEPLCALQAASYAAVDGSELRHAAPIDWESAVPSAHTLVSERAGELEAWLRFRVRAEVELCECAARDAHGAQSILRFLRRLLREHGRARIEAHLPPPHPLARELWGRGAVLESNRLGGAAQLCLVDPAGLFADTSAHWLAALEAAGGASVSFELAGRSWLLERHGSRLAASAGRSARAHLSLPPGWGAGLITGQRDHRDLAWHQPSEHARLAAALFPGGTPLWSYAPVFEIADD